MQTLNDVLRGHAHSRGDALALVYPQDGRSWTFAQLQQQSNQAAAALAALGIGAQDRIAVLDKNVPEYFVYLYGGAKLGAVTVAVNWRLAAPEIEYVLNHSQAKVLLVGRAFAAQLAQMHLPHLRQIIVVGDGTGATGSTAATAATDAGTAAYPAFAQWIGAHAGAVDPQIAVAAGDTCLQLYTSGTTGRPKGVETTHHNLFGTFAAGFNLYRMSAASVSLVCMPLFHIGASGWGLISHFYGARVVVLNEAHAAQIVAQIPAQQVSHALLVPAVLQQLVQLPGTEAADFSSLQIILYGASPISEAVLVQSMRLFHCGFMQAYGLTETTGLGALLLPEDHDPGGPRAHLLRSCGKAPGALQIKLLGSDGAPVAADGDVGEIWIHGSSIMKGYWQDPAATRAAINADGWLRTGDMAYQRDGYLFIHDRAKDMIISGGENVYPAEVENVLMQRPGIRDVAVIGVPSERWGETVKAIITAADPALREADVLAFCAARLARYKCPTSVDWVDAIPRNPSGKILKNQLREPYWVGKTRRVG